MRDLRDKVTVVIPNYNGMQYLGACLDSLLSGSALPEILVVDNHSQDGSCELIREKYPQVRLMALRANTGFCHAVNCGLHSTRTKYAILLNNDTRVQEHFVEEMLAAISQSGKIFSAQAKMLSMQDENIVDDAGDLYCALGWAFARGKGKKQEKYSRETEIFSSCAGAAIYRMSVFDAIGWFDERHYCYLEDVDIGYRARIYGYRNVFAPKAVVYHAGSAATGSRYNSFKEVMTAGNSAYLAYKNMPAVQYALNLPLLSLGRAVKRSYFRKKGLGESYDRGIARGKYLCAAAKDQKWLEDGGEFYRKGSIPEEACIEGKEEQLNEILPMYLGRRVPFQLAHLGNYVKIEGQLLTNTFRRLRN